MIKQATIFIIISLLFCQGIIAQGSIKTVKKFNHVVDYQFTDEWQYLSTELLLFNADRFSKLVNDLHPRKKSHWLSKLNQEQIEYLLITANIRDIKHFGGDLTYPIYNFQASKDENGYNVHIDDQHEVIRIFDNLPLAPTHSNIDASIEGKIITDKTSDKVLRSIADQLINIADIPNPSAASLSIVREFGRFMKSSLGKNLYKFNSTIRLYEGQDFNKHLYSVDLYAFIPSTKKLVSINTLKLEEHLQSCDNPEVNRTIIESCINFKAYPYFAVVNYKSKYASEEVRGDEITAETIRKRRQKIQYKFDQGTIPSKATYVQEMKFLDFLELFASFKSEVNTYRLNQKNKITKDFSKNLFVIAQAYHGLLQTYRNRQIEFANDAGFNNIFKDKYEDIIDNAELYFELNQALKNIKLANGTLNILQNANKKFTYKENNTFLRNLHSLDIPADQQQSELAISISNAIAKLEMECYKLEFENKINELKHLETEIRQPALKIPLIELTKNTHCNYCLEQAKLALEEYNLKYELSKKQQSTQELRITIAAAKEAIFTALIYEDQISNYLNETYPDTVAKPAFVDMLVKLKDDLILKRTILEQLIAYPTVGLSYGQINTNKQDIQTLVTIIEEGYVLLCAKLPQVCKQ